MRVIIGIGLLIIWTAPMPAMASDNATYADCVLDYLKPGMSRSAVGVIVDACRTLSIPGKCRALPTTRTTLDLRGAVEVGTREACIQDCEGASFFSRHFGDCAKGD